MTDWDRAQDLFEEGNGRSEAERETLLVDADPEVAALVRLLWVQQAPARSFLVNPPQNPSQAGAFQRGQQIGSRFMVLERIGSGGMGEVYKARDALLGRTVAIKAIREDLADNAEFRVRLEREARALCALAHPHICALYDLCWEAELPYLVMEFLSGQTLAQRIGERRLTLDEIIRVADAMANALSFAHERGFIHRDLKPTNVMLTLTGVKLLDFGIAKQVSDALSAGESGAMTSKGSSVTHSGELVGSAAYMSPEQAAGKPLDATSDIFSLGAVLYEMATGKRAFPVDSADLTLTSVVSREPAPVRSLEPAIPRRLERVIEKCLKKSPLDRYSTVSEVREQLQQVVAKPFRGRAAAAATGLVTVGLVLAAWLHAPDIKQNGSEVAQHPKSVVILPFTNASKNPEMEYLVDGLSESLTNTLSRSSRILVIARSEALAYKNRDGDVRKIGRDLKVDSVVIGRATFSAGRMRVQTELVDTRSGIQLWGQEYEGVANDALKIRDDLVRQVSERLIGKVEATHQNGRTTRNAEAFQLYMRGRHALNRYSVADLQRAISYFDRALEADPEYALAYSALADCYWSLSGAALPPNEAFPKSRAAAQHAAQLDPSLAQAHVALGVIHCYYEFRPIDGERELRLAIALDPNDAMARMWLANALSNRSQFEEAIAQAQIAHRLDPISPFIETGLGQMYYFAGDPLQAIRRLRGVVAVDPTFYNGRFFLGTAYLYAHQYANAIAEFNEARRLDPTQPFPIGNLAYAYAMAGDRIRAHEYLRELNRLNQKRYVPQYLFALISVALGDRRSALQSLRQALLEHDDMIALMKVDHLLDPLRSEPEFKSLLLRVGFDASGTPAG